MHTAFIPKVYTESLRALYMQHRNPETALGMEKYMKNKFKAFGIKRPQRDIINKEFQALNGFPPQNQLYEVVKLLWEMPEREMQYYAMELLFRFRKKIKEEDINCYENIITSKSWWDTIDFIAANLVGYYFKNFPEQIPIITSKWMASGNIWLQRTCILFQLKYKKETAPALLFSFIEPLTSSKEFFIQKAIGWALREYAKTNAQAVIDFVNSTPLKPLSKREALRRIIN